MLTDTQIRNLKPAEKAKKYADGGGLYLYVAKTGSKLWRMAYRFNDKEKLDFLRRLAEKQGLIILTDSDGAGFVLRNYRKGALPKDRVKQAYIPDVKGKERRKRKGGKEGKLGVEGMSPAVLLEALRRAGATFEDEAPPERGEAITKADLFALGLSGGEGSAEKRRLLLKRLDLPEHLTANGMLEALNLLFSREELEALLAEA